MTSRATLPMAIVLAALSLLSLAVGNAGFILGGVSALESGPAGLLLISRVPRLVAVVVAGGGMCVAGMITQTIARNRFVSPSTVGTVAWCKLGILTGTLAFARAPIMPRMALAFAFSLAGTFFFMRTLSRAPVRNIVTVPLIGMILGAVVESANTYLATRYDLVQNMESWLQGSFALVVRGRYELLYIGVPAAGVMYLYADKFTIAGMGGDFARGLGLNHGQIMAIGLSLTALMTSIVTITVGGLPFVDLAIPNLAAVFRGDNLRSNLLDTALLGADFVLFCDLVSRLVMRPYEVPVGVTASLLGGSVFLWLLVRRNRLAGA
ncbi:MAG: iron chelate uptake ABC transporter family permease subunit [Planctomycetota bacterium]|jgi:iron complex transport system permease protein|nr:iron chelate uptake ABC transporter family permease subunit [Planctomycetota bacterium]